MAVGRLEGALARGVEDPVGASVADPDGEATVVEDTPVEGPVADGVDEVADADDPPADGLEPADGVEADVHPATSTAATPARVAAPTRRPSTS
ncbi:MAG: hypothetical protein M3140_08780, partial [Actinomycetota bacterium]|nr:hypothetical protein [Actinomycetota bacterium]